MTHDTTNREMTSRKIALDLLWTLKQALSHIEDMSNGRGNKGEIRKWLTRAHSMADAGVPLVQGVTPALSVLADIRRELGVGDKPMLAELPGIVREREKLLERAAGIMGTLSEAGISTVLERRWLTDHAKTKGEGNADG